MLSIFCVFSVKNELQMITNGVSRFGGDDSGDTRRGRVDEANPLFGKITRFCQQNVSIFEKYDEKTVTFESSKTV